MHEYRRIIQFIGFVSEPVARWVDERSRVEEVTRAKPGPAAASAVRRF
jgi:hypothetical protein